MLEGEEKQDRQKSMQALFLEINRRYMKMFQQDEGTGDSSKSDPHSCHSGEK